MFWVRRKQKDLSHQGQDQRWDGEMLDTQIKQESAGGQTLSTPTQSDAGNAPKSSPCISGKSASPELGAKWNKSSVSGLQAISSETQSITAELANTSKTPHGENGAQASQCNEAHPAQYHNKHRSMRVRDTVSNGSTRGEASEQTQRQDILKGKSKIKMKHLFSKANTEEITGSSAETQERIQQLVPTVSHLPTFDILSNESEEEEEEEEEGDDLLDSWQNTSRESESIIPPRTVSESSSTLPLSADSLQPRTSQLNSSAISDAAPVSSDGHGVPPLLEQTGRSRVAPLPPSAGRGRSRVVVWTLHECNWHTPRTRPGSSRRNLPPQSTQVNRSETADKSTSNTDTLQSCNEPRGTSGQSGNESLDDMVLCDIKDLDFQECQAAKGGATAASESPEDSKRVTVCGFQPRLSDQLWDEQEGDQCRICHCGDSSPSNPLISPCRCSGSLQFIHLDCLKAWILTQKRSGFASQSCELCLGPLTDPNILNLINSDQGRQVVPSLSFLRREADRLVLGLDGRAPVPTPISDYPMETLPRPPNLTSLPSRRVRRGWRHPPSQVTSDLQQSSSPVPSEHLS